MGVAVVLLPLLIMGLIALRMWHARHITRFIDDPDQRRRMRRQVAFTDLALLLPKNRSALRAARQQHRSDPLSTGDRWMVLGGAALFTTLAVVSAVLRQWSAVGCFVFVLALLAFAMSRDPRWRARK